MGEGTSEGIVVVAADPADLAATAALHRRALPDGFFATLGVRFLRSYHRMFLSSPHAVALVARRGSDVVGFLVGTTDDVAHVRWASRTYWWRLAAAGAAALAVRPRILFRFLRSRLGRYLQALLRLRRVTRGADDAAVTLGATQRTASLVHVAVSDAVRGRGVGRALVSSYQQLAAGYGAEQAVTSTKADDDGATGFYTSLGWALERQVADVEGRPYDRLRLEL